MNKNNVTYNENLNHYLLNNISCSLLKKMVLYVLEDGKKIRYFISEDISYSIQKFTKLNNNCLFFSLSIELLHNSSLIIDDLPFMDNDQLRRNKYSAHQKYGINNSIILAYFIIFSSMDMFVQGLERLSFNIVNDYQYKSINDIILLLLDNYNEQCLNAIEGQFLDIYPSKTLKYYFVGQLNEYNLNRMILKKTSSFFQISFINSYLVSGGNKKNFKEINRLANIFGLIYQIADDFADIDQDLERNKNDIQINYVIVLGKELAYQRFIKYIESFVIGMKSLNLYSDLFENITKKLLKKVIDIA